ncbi:hypothetical protein BYT27DRAFT_7343520 [Phlegmacium glaucopus]|nr:hypothetical protein BYT27DRAFT_7343520 [Phlegmacium glaucopus]
MVPENAKWGRKQRFHKQRGQPKGTKDTAPKKSQPAAKAPTAAQKKASASHRASVEDVPDDNDATRRAFPQNPATIIESDDDDDVLVDVQSNSQPKTATSSCLGARKKAGA